MARIVDIAKVNGSACLQQRQQVKWLKFPYDIVDVDEDLNRELLADFTGERTSFVQVGPKKWFFPSGYRADAETYYNFRTRPDDIWIVTFPRSGTTCTQEMVWLLANELDFDKAAAIPLTVRFPFLEFSSFFHPQVKSEFLAENGDFPEKCAMIEEISKPACVTLARSSTGRRFIKTHLPFDLLPPDLLRVGCKVIYVARNPKDVAVSFYHLNRLFRTQGYLGDFPKYWNYFQRNLQAWTPYWAHVQQGWNRRDEENCLFLFYEEMNKNLPKTIKDVSKFLGFHYATEQIRSLEDHLKIDNFRKNESVNIETLKDLGILSKSEDETFVRKGESGGWRNYFGDDLNKIADEWIETNLQNTNLKFPNY